MSFEQPNLDSPEHINETENVESQELSPEFLKFKSEFEKISERFEAILYKFRQRRDENLMPFLHDEDIEKLGAVVAGSKDAGLYSQEDLGGAAEILQKSSECIGAIEILRGARGVQNDPDSLIHLARNLGEISTLASEVKSASKQLNSPLTEDLFRISESLDHLANEKAQYISQRAEALMGYQS